MAEGLRLISRKEAKANGLKRYFTGVPCPESGHISERLVSSCACMACVREKASKKRKENPELYRQLDAQIYAKNAERKRAESRRWRARNKDKVKAYGKEWHSKNADRVRERDSARWAAKGKELYAKNREWRSKNPEKARSYDLVRCRRKSLPSGEDDMDFTIFVLQEASAACVRRKESYGFDWHVDHMTPLSRGGEHKWDNIQLLPHFLNRKKYNKMWLTKPFEWLDYL